MGIYSDNVLKAVLIRRVNQQVQNYKRCLKNSHLVF